jgi:hypothetical protein
MKRRRFIALAAAAGALMTIAAPANAATTHDEYAVCYPVDGHQTMCYDLLSRYNVTDTGSGNRVYSGDAVETWTITDSTGSVTFDRTYEYKYHYLQKADSTSYQVYRYALDDQYTDQGQTCQLHQDLVISNGEVRHQDDVGVTCS